MSGEGEGPAGGPCPERGAGFAASSGLDLDVLAALERLCGGVFVMTSQFEDERSGGRVLAVKPCATEPLLVSVALRKGHVVEPLIRDSRHFGICEVMASDKLALHKFPPDDAGHAGDPFDSLAVVRGTTGVPLLGKTRLRLECEVARHIDLEADHVLYIGLVVDGWASAAFEPVRPGVGGDGV